MITKIQLKNFRNHNSLEINLTKPSSYIFGDNGSGKTSILESIYLIATTKSHRSTDEKDVIKYDQPFAQVKLQNGDDKFELVISKNGKRAFLNGAEKKRLSEFIGHLRAVMFAPEDIELITGSPGERREFIDLELMQMDKKYLKTLNQYRQVLKQRNALLKRLKPEDDLTFLNIISEQLCPLGEEIILRRQEFVRVLNEELQKTYKLFSDNKINLIFDPNCVAKDLKKTLFKNQKTDIFYQLTQNGPHRDDLHFDLNDVEAKGHASQGEMRLIVISVKLALVYVIERLSNKKAVLLLDDILSELDLDKQKKFLDNLPKDNQIIMNGVAKIENQDIEIIEIGKE